RTSWPSSPRPSAAERTRASIPPHDARRGSSGSAIPGQGAIRMKEKRNWRAIATWILFIFALLYVLPSFVGMPDWYPFKKSLGGGLHLEGGLELRYTVDWKKAVEGIGLKAGDSIR